MGRKPLLLTVENIHERYEINENGCWIWQTPVDKDGYGEVTQSGVKSKAHRASYRLFKGRIPDGMKVCHTCDTPPCINPDHLFLGTTADNNRDKVEKGRSKRGVSHHAAVLTEEDIASIRSLLNDGITQQKIADRYGVSQTAISKIKRGVRWTHV